MESLSASVEATCPLAFSGASGPLFLNVITTLVAAHCSLTSDPWPEDNAADVIAKSTEGAYYDFIVVGGGTAGSLVASQLSRINPSWSTLLVEAGDNPGIDSEIPGILFLNQNTDSDWSYKTDADEQSCLGLNFNSCIWSKGKYLGGSSSINAMLYIRGHPNDYDEWEKAGNFGWGYSDLVNYFESIEKELNLTDTHLIYNDYNKWYEVLSEGWKEMGIHSNQTSHEACTGTRRAKLLIKNGQRVNTAKIYLKENGNLDIIKNTVVYEIIIDRTTKTVIGLKLRHKSGIQFTLFLKKEVILSAGTIATPQLLMLSGIGPAKHLQNIGILPILNLPVGKNLQDHLLLPLFFKTNLHNTITPDMVAKFLLQYMLSRTGPFSNIGIIDFMSFVNTNNVSDAPNIQFHHMYFSKNNAMLRRYLEAVGYKNEVINSIEEENAKCDLIGIYPTVLHPKSTGEILLKDRHVTSKTIIKAKYFDHPDDVTILMKAIKLAYKLEETTVFREMEMKIIKLNISGCPRDVLRDTNYWNCYIRHMATTIYHPVGTAKMGPQSDSTSVVSKHLLVHGMKNLRVIDASVMPKITGGNTMAPTLAIAQKGVDIIKEHYLSKFNNEL